MQLNFPIFPEQASSVASQADYLYLFLVLITTFFSLLIAILILFFAIKYGKRPDRQAEQIEGSTCWRCLDDDSARHLHGDVCLGRAASISASSARPPTP